MTVLYAQGEEGVVPVYLQFYMAEFSGSIWSFETLHRPSTRAQMIATHQESQRSKGWRVTDYEEFRFFGSLEEARVVQDEERAVKPFDFEANLEELPGQYTAETEAILRAEYQKRVSEVNR